MKQFTRARPDNRVAQRATLALSETVNRLDRIHILAVVLALGMTTYLAIEPSQNWLLLLLCGLAAIGTDGIIRHHPRATFERLDDTALYLFVPVLFTLGLGIFLEEVASGYVSLALGLLSVIPYWAILYGEYESVDRSEPAYHTGRLLLNVSTYVIAFLFFVTIYDFDLNLFTAAFAAAIVSVMLGIEVLREEGMETTRTILYALATGVLVAEAAWSTHFLPLEASAAAVFLLLTFYMIAGLMHTYLAERLNLRVAAEFACVGVAGVAIIALSRVYN
ncbi:MAG: hypothetical protein ABIP58_07965 [Dehalococcoidia bacterium]